jgi:hypothetical protein
VVAADGDYGDASVYGVSLLIELDSLEVLMEGGWTVGVVRSSLQPAPVWTTLDALSLANTITWPGAYDVWVGRPSLLYPGAQLLPDDSIAADSGSTVMFNGFGLVDMSAGSGPAITLMNATQSPIAGGLAQSAIVNGAQANATPLSALSLFGEQTQKLLPTQTVTLLASPFPTPTGTMLMLPSPMAQSITVTLSPTHPTARILYSVDAGGFVTDA